MRHYISSGLRLHSFAQFASLSHTLDTALAAPSHAPLTVPLIPFSLSFPLHFGQQVQRHVTAEYFKFQKEVTPDMRSSLVNWLVEVHQDFRLTQV